MTKKDILSDHKVLDLLQIIVEIKSLEEAKKFFRDLLTEAELKEFSNRWKVAQMLWQKIPYSKIELETGLSSTTIARISKWLNQGRGGYKKALEKLD